jgi:hypothetical protein
MASPRFVVTVDGTDYEVDAPDERTAWRWANAVHERSMREQAEQQRATAERRARAVAEMQQQERQRFDEAERARPLLERAAINLGAGFDTLLQGAKQLVGRGPTDAELAESREIKARAAENMPGGALLQVAGETLPTLTVPAGAFATGARLLTGGRLLKNASRLKTAVADTALAGGAAGALQPVAENESRLANMALGTAGGAVVPAAVQGVPRLVRALTEKGARARAGEAVVEALGEPNAQRTAAAVDAYLARGANEIPLSTAAIANSNELAALERAARARNPAEWAALDADTDRAVWRNIEQATSNADDLERLRAVRSQNWIDRQTQAVQSARADRFQKELADFYQNLEQALRSPPGQNQMRPVLLEIKRQLDELGPDITPEHLMTLRANMQGAIKGTPDNPFATAPRTDPYYISLKQELDRILNDVTGGKWQDVVAGYAADSVPVQAAKSSKAIREAFVTPEGVLRSGDLGGVPRVTEARLRQALAAKGESKFGDALDPSSRRVLEKTLDALNRQNITQRIKTAGTGGGGSNTAMDLLAQKATAKASSVVPFLGPLYQAARDRGDDLLMREIDRLLREPDAFVQGVRQTLKAGQPLPRAQAEILAALQRAPGVALPALLHE